MAIGAFLGERHAGDKGTAAELEQPPAPECLRLRCEEQPVRALGRDQHRLKRRCTLKYAEALLMPSVTGGGVQR